MLDEQQDISRPLCKQPRPQMFARSKHIGEIIRRKARTKVNGLLQSIQPPQIQRALDSPLSTLPDHGVRAAQLEAVYIVLTTDHTRPILPHRVRRSAIDQGDSIELQPGQSVCCRPAPL